MGEGEGQGVGFFGYADTVSFVDQRKICHHHD